MIFHSALSCDLETEYLNHGGVTEGPAAVLVTLSPEHGLRAEEEAAQTSRGQLTPARGTGSSAGGGQEK